MRTMHFGHYVPLENTVETKSLSPQSAAVVPALETMPPQEMTVIRSPLAGRLQQDVFTPISPPPANPELLPSTPPALRFGKKGLLQKMINRLFSQSP